jgi:hypothetical protein
MKGGVGAPFSRSGSANGLLGWVALNSDRTSFRVQRDKAMFDDVWLPFYVEIPPDDPVVGATQKARS